MFSKIKQLVQSDSLHWVNLIFIGSYHLALLILLPVYLYFFTPSGALLGATFLLWMFSLMSITTGYHRLYSHKTYEAHPMIEWPLLFFGTLATEGSAINWSHDHRLHHRHVDTEMDPYGTPKGFWHSHMLWLFQKREEVDERLIRDLVKRKTLVFQHKYFGWLVVATNVIVLAVVGWWTGDWFGTFVIAFLLRTFLVHHCTWFINSLAHMWGSRPYATEHTAVNNLILALLTFGEGYHNYHHTFSGDYRNGVRWYQFDPPKYVIWFGSKLGLAKNLKRVNKWTIQRKLVQADKKLMLQHLQEIGLANKEKLIASIDDAFESLSGNIASLKMTIEAYQREKRRAAAEEAEELRQRIHELRQEIRNDFRTWRQLVNQVLDMQPTLGLT